MGDIGRSFFVFFAVIGILFLSLPIGVLALHMVETQAWHSLDSALVTQAIYLSLLTTFITICVTLIFGTPVGYLLARYSFRGHRLVNVLVELPIILPPAVAGLALLLTLGRNGLLGSILQQFDVVLPFTMPAVVIAQIFVAAPFYVRSAQVGFQGVPREIEDAAKVDGATGVQLFMFVTLPLTARALGAGIVLCWARALGEFGATILFAGSLQGRTQTMPLLIYGILERDIDAAVTTGLILVVFALLALLLWQGLNQKSDITELP